MFPPRPPLRRPPNGTQAHDLSRELEFGRPAQVGATPFWDRRRAASRKETRDKSVNREPKSVTDVLNHECYLCIDCADDSQLSTLNSQLLCMRVDESSEIQNRRAARPKPRLRGPILHTPYSILLEMLTTLAKVKTRLGISDATQDALLTQTIEAVSARFDGETGRTLEYAVAAQEIARGDEVLIPLRAYPLDSITQFEVHTWADGWEVWPDPVNYTTGPFGAIVHLEAPLATGDDMVRITYNGGYQAIPPNLEHACIEQVAFQFQLRQYSGVFRVESGTNTYLEVADRLWVPSVRRVLKQFRRHSYI